MTDFNYFITLERFGVEVLIDRLLVKLKSRKNKTTLPFNTLISVELKKMVPSYRQIAWFWFTRFITYNGYTGTSWLGSRFDYRLQYDLIFHTQNQSYKLTINDFDKFKTWNEIDRLNKIIAAHNN
jgi:hypothetical protein